MILAFAPPYRYGGHTHCNLLQHLITRPCAGPARCRRVRTETCAMSLWRRLLARPAKPQPMLPLYGAVVEYARAPRWYVEGGVEDSVDGRFDMLALVMTLLLLRLDREGDPLRQAAFDLPERFLHATAGQVGHNGNG